MTPSFPKNELNQWLRHAAESNLPERVDELIAQGANPYDTDDEGRTAFNCAASTGLHALKRLTEIAFEDTQKPASERRWPEYGINTPSGKYQSTLITYACKACSASTVHDMLKAGADRSIVNGSGWNLLHATAVMPGRKEVLQLLRSNMGRDALRATTTHEYRTRYGHDEVIFAAGLTPSGLCEARIAQDKQCPPELKDYLPILNPAIKAGRPDGNPANGLHVRI